MTVNPGDVIAAPKAHVTGTWQRHCAIARRDQALNGHSAYGRWGTRDGFPVLYLGRPEDSVIAEAYRHIVDPVLDNDITLHLAPRAVVTCTVDVVDDVLDLREAVARSATGLSIDLLQSGTDDSRAYSQCQEVAAVAHQLGFLGIITPAATRLGETLVLFTSRLQADQRPVRSGEDIIWTRWPSDPRVPTLRIVPNEN
jgi:RES domain-containing protein